MQAPERSSGRPFRDRRDAGEALGRELAQLASENPIVIALPRGGVPVGYEVARALSAPLDIGLVRKLGAPLQPELGIGALGEQGRAIIDVETVRRLGISRRELAEVVKRERRELERRAAAYRPGRPPLNVAGRLVVLVDDGLATGVTAVAAARVLKERGARAVVLAVPVCPRHVEARLRSEFDRIVCLRSPEPFYGVGAGYDDFSQTTDGEVVGLLARACGSSQPRESEFCEAEVSIPAGVGLVLDGTLRTPARAAGLVIFAHGSGSSRHSPRNRAVAARLNESGFATLLFDLLTDAEARDRANVFDIELLSVRLLAACRWAEVAPQVAGLPIGLFGASTGAAAALRAAATASDRIAAVVSRGGRPDLAGAALREVVAPTLLIVGGADRLVLELNHAAAAELAGPREVAVIPSAGHLFEEPGALEHVADLAADWFEARFAAVDAGGRALEHEPRTR
jgi:predicted phosphoribosyltransferase/dienelactone hydrolase